MASDLKYNVIVNLQADEIPLDPGLFNDLIEPFLRTSVGMGTLKRAMKEIEDVVSQLSDANKDIWKLISRLGFPV